LCLSECAQAVVEDELVAQDALDGDAGRGAQRALRRRCRSRRRRKSPQERRLRAAAQPQPPQQARPNAGVGKLKTKRTLAALRRRPAALRRRVAPPRCAAPRSKRARRRSGGSGLISRAAAAEGAGRLRGRSPTLRRRDDFAICLIHYRPAMPFGNRKNIFEDLFSSVLSQFKKNITSLET